MNKTKLIGYIGLLMASLSTAYAADAALPTQEQIDAARNAGSSIGGSLSSGAPQLDSSGNYVRDANGNVVMVPASQKASKDSLDMFNSATGTTGYQQTGNPAGSGQTGGASFTSQGSASFSCKSNEVYPKYLAAGNVRLKINSCDINSGIVDTAICTQLLDGTGYCLATGTGFTDSVAIKAGAYYSFNSKVSVGYGCADSMCQATIKTVVAVSANAATLAQANKNTTTEQLSDIQSVATSKEYAQSVQTDGAALAKCMAQNQTDGVFASCDESRTQVSFDKTTTAVNSADCTTEKICLSKAVKTQTSTKVCTQEFPLTERTSTFNRTNKVCKERTANTEVGTEWGTVYYISDSNCYTTHTNQTFCTYTNMTPTAYPTLDSCVVALLEAGWWAFNWEYRFLSCQGVKSNEGFPPLPEGIAFPQLEDCGDMTGYTRGANTQSSIISWHCINDDCSAGYWDRDVTYVDEVPDLVSAFANPPVSGICSSSIMSDSRDMTCPNGTWVGRVNEAASCTIQYYDEYSKETRKRELEEPQMAGCGWCSQPVLSDICYAGGDPISTCSTSDTDGCILKETNPTQLEGNLVTEQTQTFECTSSSEECVKWSSPSESSACMTNSMTFGTDKMAQKTATSDGSLGSAIASAAVADQITKSAAQNGPISPSTIKIFDGKYATCEMPSGLGNLVQKNCCKIGLSRPSAGNIIQEGCTDDQVELAAKRRGGFDHYLGSWCSKKIKFMFFSKCVEQTQGYCIFPGLLPKIVQEQGRNQLQSLASGPMKGTTKTALQFPYYSSGNGAWTPVQSSNGIQFTAWQWPSYCKDPGTAATVLMNQPEAQSCPELLEVWFATCPNGQCGPLPNDPSAGASNWILSAVNPLSNQTESLSQYTLSLGACDTGSYNCSYTITALPSGGGGRVSVSKTLVWSLYANMTEADMPKGMPSAGDYASAGIGDLLFKTASLPGMASSSLPATVPLTFSTNSGASWATIQIPTSIPTDYNVPGTDLIITGSCDGMINTCTYTVRGTVGVTNKPWGDARSPDCSGFTLGQLSVLDFGKMDLSAWTATLTNNNSATGATSLAQSAADQVKGMNSAYNSTSTNKITSTGGGGSGLFARIAPNSGFGPINSNLTVSPVWPDPSADVTQPGVYTVQTVVVDWGDCSGTQTVSQVNNKAFQASHTYSDPASIYSRCGKGALAQDYNGTVTLTIGLSDGSTKTVKLSIADYWYTIPPNPAGGGTSGALTNTTTNIDTSSTPTNNIYNKP